MPVYAFGSNGAGQLGVGHTNDLSLPTKCLFQHEGIPGVKDHQQQGRVIEREDEGGHHDYDDSIVSLAAGGNHTLILFSSGKVYAAGSNANGRCAHDAPESLLSFVRVVIYDDNDDEEEEGAGECAERKDRAVEESKRRRRVDHFSAISATWEASFLVDAATGKLYVVGLGTKGELGLGQAITDAPRAVQVPNFPPAGTEIVQLCSSGWHTVAVLSNGQVYGWGNARKGQLGKEGVQQKIHWSPKHIDDDDVVSSPVRQAACGREFTVLVGDSAHGCLTVLGSDKWQIRSTAPASVKGYSAISTSWHGVYVHNINGSLVAWGRSDRGQLPPSDIPKLGGLSVGSEHAIAVVGSSRLVAFGWGEHGNCGPQTDAHGNVAGRLADIPLDLAKNQTVATAGAGCATSWVVIK